MHTRAEVRQKDFVFDVVTEQRGVKLLANSKEQIFVEKLKSMLKLGAFSGRYKDVFDMYFLKDKLSKRTLRAYVRMYIFDDRKMREGRAGGRAGGGSRVRNRRLAAGVRADPQRRKR